MEILRDLDLDLGGEVGLGCCGFGDRLRRFGGLGVWSWW